MNQDREASIREEVRRQIEAEEQQRLEREAVRRSTEEQFHEEQLRQRIIQEETRSFYQNSPDYIEFINENGDSEWLTRKQIRAREGYFDYEEHVEDPDRGRRVVGLRITSYVLGLLAVAIVLLLYILEDPASVHVLCNVQGAEIFVDGQRVEERTDALLKLSPGEHLIEVRHLGYVNSAEPYQVLSLKEGEQRQLSFLLQAAP